MHLKICGITEPAEIDLLATLPVNFVGLWHGVMDGPADLTLPDLCRLTAAARDAGGPEPVLVTFLADVAKLTRAVAESGVRWIQLHGFQAPAVVHALREALPAETMLMKVLHVQGAHCLERPVIGAYEKAGVDLFLFDAVATNGRIGSTGQALKPEIVLALADMVTCPFFLAGGISDTSQDLQNAVKGHALFHGIDVDSNARRPGDRALCATRITAISRAWFPTHHTRPGGCHVQPLH